MHNKVRIRRNPHTADDELATDGAECFYRLPAPSVEAIVAAGDRDASGWRKHRAEIRIQTHQQTVHPVAAEHGRDAGGDTMSRLRNHAIHGLLAPAGVVAFGTIALNRGETVNALWVVVATYLIAYRYHSLYFAKRVTQLAENRPTPATPLNDGLDYVPTNRYVLFGHHFAAIAGAGPLVGPVLAAQMGYLPDVLWILAGVVLAGAVQDFMILFISTRRDGRSLGEMIKAEMGAIAGLVALFGNFMIMIIGLNRST